MRSAPPPTPDVDLLGRVPEALARRSLALPVHVAGGVLHVRSAPGAEDPAQLDELRMHAGAYDVIAEPHPDAVRHLLVAYARPTITATEVRTGHDSPAASGAPGAPGAPSAPSAPSAVGLLDALLDLASGSDASDLHLVPTAAGLRVRQRIDGDLHDVATIDPTIATAVLAHTKVRAGLDVAERRLPQDGRFSHALPGSSVDVRVATMPTRFGERITLRLLPDGPAGVALESLGLPAVTLAALERAIGATDGLVIVCGPTGSGKTTTLHALLTRLATGPRNIMTIEDPIERILPGTSQTQVDTTSGLGFADGLRHLLRHDPDVMLIGEIRDPETARLAIEAAHTGHLVLSSLHAVDAPGALTRLTELGIPAAMLADTVRVVVAQRLLALPCPDCAGSGHDPDAAEVEHATCGGCAGTGTRGRSAIGETLELDERIRDLLRDGRGPASHHRALSRAVSPPLREVALQRSSAGLARRSDALRATPSPPAPSRPDGAPDRAVAAIGTLGLTPPSSPTMPA